MKKLVIVLVAVGLTIPLGGAAGGLMMVNLLARGATTSTPVTPPKAVPGLNQELLKAFVNAATKTPTLAPSCKGMRWQILAGIGQIESHNAEGHTISPAGDVTPPIIGPLLDGSGAGGNTTAIRDTDQGVWDRNPRYDAAVGVLQFIPSSWRAFGRDGNGDHIADPHNVYDNALGAVVHLCGTTPVDLSNPDALRQRLYGYNQSWSYVDNVTQAIATFDATEVVDDSNTPAGTGQAAVMIAAAKKKLNTPYSWGGGNAQGPSTGICCSPNGSDGRKTVGFDCSGLTLYAAAQIGKGLPHSAQAQSSTGKRIEALAGLGALKPGDLVFFSIVPSSRMGIHHVGIYLGGGQMINAPRPGQVVRIEPMWMDQYAGAVRLT